MVWLGAINKEFLPSSVQWMLPMEMPMTQLVNFVNIFGPLLLTPFYDLSVTDAKIIAIYHDKILYSISSQINGR